MYELVISIFFCFYNISVGSQNCADSMVYFVLDLRTVLTFRQCGIFCFGSQNCADTQTVWYILFWISELCRHSDSMVYFVLDLRTVLTLKQCGIFCFSFYCWQELCWHSDSVVYFVFHFIADKDCVDTQTVWYILFFILLLTRTL